MNTSQQRGDIARLQERSQGTADRAIRKPIANINPNWVVGPIDHVHEEQVTLIARFNLHQLNAAPAC